MPSFLEYAVQCLLPIMNLVLKMAGIMSFPLNLETYVLEGRCYRRMPYSGTEKKNQHTVVGTVGDTEDLYADGDEHEDGISCAVNEFHRREVGEEEVYVEEASASGTSTVDVTTVSHKVNTAVNFQAPPGLGPPPGFEKNAFANNKAVKNGAKEKTGRSSPLSEELPYKACEDDPRVEYNGKKWRAKVIVPALFHSRLIGQRGATKREMEEATQCRVSIPEKGSKSETVEISSTVSDECVGRCLDRIDLILIKAKEGARFTHFAAIPMNSEEVKDSFLTFKDMVMATDFVSQSCKDERLFVSVNKLHLTLAMMRIFSEADKETAAEALRKAQERIRLLLKGEPLKAEVEGLQFMNDDPGQVDVLYAGVKGEVVQKTANIVRDCMIESGLSPETERGRKLKDTDVKLHMTLLNSRYLSEKLRKLSRRFRNARFYDAEGQPHAKRRRLNKDQNAKRMPFDAKTLIEEMGMFYFGNVTIDKFVICSMNTEGKDGFYELLTSIDL